MPEISQRYEGPDRRDTNGNGLFGNMPLWVRAAGFIGIPGVLLGYLVWLGGQTMPSMQRELIVIHQEIVEVRKTQQDQLRVTEALQRLAERTCARNINNQTERDAVCYGR
jgi:hypothetical protein